MTITLKQFFKQLAGARLSDRIRWGRLNQEAALWEMFAFSDDGAHWLDRRGRNLQRLIIACDAELHRQLSHGGGAAKWDRAKSLPGYVASDERIIH